jgi:hypothetical protein
VRRFREEDLTYLTTIKGRIMTNHFTHQTTEKEEINLKNQKLDYPKKIIYNHLSKMACN